MGMFDGGALWAGILSGGVSQVQNTQSLVNGKMDTNDYVVKTTENVSSAVGVMAGFDYGAIVGTSIFPGVGTILGSIAGGVLGDRVGRFVGHQTGELVMNNQSFAKGNSAFQQQNQQEQMQ